MSVSLTQLSGASAGPGLTEQSPPNMLSIGDSLMWGQGLEPAHRFRDIVRARIASEHGRVAELSMARSGARMQITEQDQALDEGLRIAGQALAPHYSPVDFAREIPNSALSIQNQLRSAAAIIQQHWTKAAVADVRWILLDGGINDIGINNILTPFRAELDGFSIRCWSAWLLEESQRIENLMEETLQIALDTFPNAAIAVNGYFPIFSYHSVASVTKLQSVGIFWNLTNVFLVTPFGLDALARASTAWQAASAHHLRRAISNVLARSGYAARITVFARSNIENDHCLFGPHAWLWGYDAFPDGVPQNQGQWVQLLAGATPEDDVKAQRIGRCDANVGEPSAAVRCRLASIGHPNVPGAIDYAQSIIHAFERAGVLQPRDSACVVAERMRAANCRRLQDDNNYRCIRLDVAACEVCSSVLDAAGSVVQDGAKRIESAGANFERAGDCVADASGKMADAAGDNFAAAAEDMEQAAGHFTNAANCWGETQQEFQSCDDQTAAAISQCRSAYQSRRDNECDIRCNSYTNCRSRYGKYNPRRYTCLAARGVCVAAAAAARAVCLAGAAAIREACELAAEAEGLMCKGTEVAQDVGCTASEGAKGAWNVLKGVGRVLVGVGEAGLVGLGRLGCAFLNGAKGVGKVLVGVGEIGLGTGLFLAGLGFYAGCTGIRWTLNGGCRLATGIVQVGCRASTAAHSVPCRVIGAFRHA